MIWNPYLRWPFRALVVTLLPMLWLLSRQSGIQLDVSTRDLLEPDLHSRENYDRIQALLPEETVVLVSLEVEDVFSESGLEVVRGVSEAFAAHPGLTGVKSLTHAIRPIRRGLGFTMVPLVSEHPDAAERERLREFCLSHPLIRNVMVSPDARHTLLVNSYDRALSSPAARQAFVEEVERVLVPFREAGVGIRVLSFPGAEVELRRTARRDAMWLFPAVLLLVTGLLWGYFRSGRVLAVMFVNLAVPVLLLPMLLQAVGFEWSPYSLLLFPLWVAIQLTLQVHCLDAWRRAGLFGRGEAIDDDLRRGLKEVLRPSVFAVLTTGVALLSLGTSPVSQVRVFGWAGAAGVAGLLIYTFGPGLAVVRLVAASRRFRESDVFPAARLRGHEPVQSGSADASRSGGSEGVLVSAHQGRHAATQGERIPAWCWGGTGQWLSRRSLGWILLGVGLTSVYGWSRLQTDVRVLEFLDPRSDTRQTVEEFDQVYGGVNLLTVDVDSGKPGGVNDLAFLRYIEQMGRFAAEEPEVTAVYSYAQVLTMLNEIWEGGRPGTLRLPDNAQLLGLFTMALGTYDLPLISSLSDPERRTASLLVRTHDLPGREYLELVQRIVERAELTAPEGVMVSGARGLHSILEADRRIVRSQLRSAGLTVLAIGLLLLGFWRSWRLVGAALLVTLLPVAVVIAVMGYLGIALNSVTLMIGALCLGMAVDHAVHFETHWRDGCRGGQGMSEALQHTLEVKARPILLSSLVLAAVFGVFAFCSFPPVAHFGGLTAMAFLAAGLTTVVVLPALLGSERGRVGECPVGETAQGR